MTHVSDLQGNEIAAPELAIDTQVEERKFTHSVVHLQTHTERPDVLELERGLLPHDLALVPRLATSRIGNGTHDGLPSS